MTDPSGKFPATRRPRFSSATLLLAFAIVALALVVILQRREISPLRAELLQLRQQRGQLMIENPARAYAVRVPQPDPNLWRWRVYLPPHQKYRLVNVQGTIPPRLISPQKGKDDSTWVADLNQAPSVARCEHTGPELSGEFNVEVSLFHYEDRWRVVVDPGHDITELPPSFIEGDWLAPTDRCESTENLVGNQRDYGDHEPIVLLQLEKPVVSPAPGGGTKRSEPTVPAPGIALWLEPL